MSTKSLICMKLKNGRYKGIYCHYDGYVSYTGKILVKHYLNSQKVKRLIALGDISYIAPNICKKNNWNNPDKRCVLAYHRDRGEPWEETKPRIWKNLKDLLRYFRQSFIDYLYIYRDGEWWYCKRNCSKLNKLEIS